MSVRHLRTGNCHYCDRAVFPPGSPEVIRDPSIMATRDHLTPASLPGIDKTGGGTVLACRFCNELRSDTPYEVFRWFSENWIFRSTTQARRDFRRFRYQCTLAGFKAARALALADREASA